MPFKINISEKGKTFHAEVTSEYLIEKKINETVKGDEIMPELKGYELEIKGTSDKAGFPGKKDVEGIALKRVLLTKGFNMRKSRPKGLRLRKTVRGNTISADTVQINLNVKKQGIKKLEEIFPEQCKGKSKKAEEKKAEEKEKVEQKEKKAEQKAETTETKV